MPSEKYPCIEMAGPGWVTARLVRIRVSESEYAPGEFEHGEAQRLIAEGIVPKPKKEKVNDQTDPA